METLKETTQEFSMEMNGKSCQDIIKKLQNEAYQFLKKKLVLNGIAILPKEIEVYYYKEGEFEDKSVHQNELQTNKNKYPAKEKMVIDFLQDKDKNQAVYFAKEKLGYVPSKIKNK